MNLDFTLMIESVPPLLLASLLTLKLTFFGAAGGIVAGIVVAAGRLCRWSMLQRFATYYGFIVRGTPLLVQLFFLYYGLAQWTFLRTTPLWAVLKDPMWCATIAIALNSGAYTCEIIRGSIKAVPKGQLDAARSLGLRRAITFFRIIAPQALRIGLPAYGNELIMLLKATALASTVSLFDVTGRAKTLVAETYAPYEIFIIAGIIYIAIGILLQFMTRSFEWLLRLPGDAR